MKSPGGSSICVITTSYPEDEGDPSGHFVDAEVRELSRAGHRVTIVKPRAGGAFGWPGVAARVRENPLRLLDAGRFVASATIEVRRAAPSKIIAHWSVPSGFPVAMMAGPDAPELELVSHGADVRLLRALPARIRSQIVTRLVDRSSRWRFVSDSLLSELCATLPSDLAREVAERAVVRASPLGMPDVRTLVQARRRALGERRLFVTAARLVPSKRIDKVIDYVAESRKDCAPVLVVLGDGPLRPHLEEVAQRWRLDARFLGKTPRKDALSWIGAADEFVHASRAEGLSTVVREAEHLGVKVTLL